MRLEAPGKTVRDEARSVDRFLDVPDPAEPRADMHADTRPSGRQRPAIGGKYTARSAPPKGPRDYLLKTSWSR
jgi:hypothetical protein